MKSQKNNKQGAEARKQSRNVIFLAASCCIVLCAFLMSTVCWAWFTGSATAGFEIQTAMYGAKVTITRQDATIADQQIISTIGNLWELDNGYVYDVTVTATGTAKTGHCKLILGSTTRNTGNLPSGETLQFQLDLTGTGTTWLQILVSWGACNTYYYGAPIASGEVVTVNPAVIPAEPQDDLSGDASADDAADNDADDAADNDADDAEDENTTQPSADDATQPSADDTITEPVDENTTQPSADDTPQAEDTP